MGGRVDVVMCLAEAGASLIYPKPGTKDGARVTVQALEVARERKVFFAPTATAGKDAPVPLASGVRAGGGYAAALAVVGALLEFGADPPLEGEFVGPVPPAPGAARGGIAAITASAVAAATVQVRSMGKSTAETAREAERTARQRVRASTTRRVYLFQDLAAVENFHITLLLEWLLRTLLLVTACSSHL